MKARRALILISSPVLILAAACSIPSESAYAPAKILTAQAVAQRDVANDSTKVAIPITGKKDAAFGTSVTVNATTNCRTGPGSSYGLVLTAHPGATFTVLGRSATSNYWIISNPAGGTCWLWGGNSLVTGDTSALPEYSSPADLASNPPATPKMAPTSPASGGQPVQAIHTPSVLLAPSAPGNLNASRTCAGSFSGLTPIWAEDVTLTWTDSTKEAGYNIYQNGSKLSMLPEGSTNYRIQFRYNEGIGSSVHDTFGVEAFNGSGTSPRALLDIPRCP